MKVPTQTEGATEEECPIILGPREQLFHLLAEAAEIEHCLMCSYLYAAFSLKRRGANSLSADENDAVDRWRSALLAVANEEMVHLLLVANLSIAIGGRPHFSRPNFPVETGYFPSGVVAKLTPFNVETLTHFIFLERPDDVKLPDGAGFKVSDSPREEAHWGLMPSLQDYKTVGRLYQALRENIAALAERMGEAVLFIGAVESQVGPDTLALEGVTTIHDLQTALRAIDTIVEQGEGSPGDREDSHYDRFRGIEAEYRALRNTNKEFEPAWPVAESPVMRRVGEMQGKLFIDDPTTAMVLDLGNAIYNLLLRCLVQAFGREGMSQAEEQSRYIDVAIGLMHAFARISTALAEMPASTRHPGINAGITFTVLRGVEPLLGGRAELLLTQERLSEIHTASQVACRSHSALSQVSAQLAEVVRLLCSGPKS